MPLLLPPDGQVPRAGNRRTERRRHRNGPPGAAPRPADGDPQGRPNGRDRRAPERPRGDERRRPTDQPAGASCHRAGGGCRTVPRCVPGGRPTTESCRGRRGRCGGPVACRQRDPTARERAPHDQGSPAGDGRGGRDLQRGAEIGQRRAARDQRGAAVVQRRAADLQGRAPVGQRGARDDQRRAEQQGERARPGEQRPAECVSVDPDPNPVPGRRSRHQAVYVGGDECVPPDRQRHRAPDH